MRWRAVRSRSSRSRRRHLRSGSSLTCWRSARRLRTPSASALRFAVVSHVRARARDLHAGDRPRPRLPPCGARRGTVYGPQRARRRRVRWVLSFLAEARGARRVVAVDNEQYVAWVRARFGMTLDGGVGFRAMAGLLGSGPSTRGWTRWTYASRRAVHVVLCFGILQRVTNPMRCCARSRTCSHRAAIVLKTYARAWRPTPRRSRFTSRAICTSAMPSSIGASRRRVCGDWGASPALTSSRSSIIRRSTVPTDPRAAASGRLTAPSDPALRSSLTPPATFARACTSARGPDVLRSLRLGRIMITRVRRLSSARGAGPLAYELPILVVCSGPVSLNA